MNRGPRSGSPPDQMTIEHFLITPFCIRNPKTLREVRGGGWRTDQDPLEPAHLEARLQLLDILPSPAVKSQTNRSFSWVFLIDPDLPSEARRQLEGLSTGGVRVILHEYRDRDPLHTNEWLLPYAGRQPDFFLTTQLDDDDAFSVDYMQELRKAVNRHVHSSAPTPVHILGSARIWMWNMIPGITSPLGTRSEWVGSAKISPCGLSLLARYPDFPLNVLSLRHKRAEDYLDFDSTPADDGVRRVQNAIRQAFSRSGICLKEGSERGSFEDLSNRTGHVVMSNHGRNVQGHRLLKRQVTSTRITGPESFPRHQISWTHARDFISKVDVGFATRFKLFIAQLKA